MPPTRQFRSGPRDGDSTALPAIAALFRYHAVTCPVVAFRHRRSSRPSPSKSPTGRTTMLALAELSSTFASGWTDVTVPVTGTVPSGRTRRTSATTADAPCARLGTMHTAVALEAVQAPGGFDDKNVVPGGSVSVRTTPVAVAAPAFATLAVMVARPPVRMAGVAVWDSDNETARPKFAVSVSGVAGAVTWCVALPPSDHAENAYVWPPS